MPTTFARVRRLRQALEGVYCAMRPPRMRERPEDTQAAAIAAAHALAENARAFGSAESLVAAAGIAWTKRRPTAVETPYDMVRSLSDVLQRRASARWTGLARALALTGSRSITKMAPPRPGDITSDMLRTPARRYKALYPYARQMTREYLSTVGRAQADRLARLVVGATHPRRRLTPEQAADEVRTRFRTFNKERALLIARTETDRMRHLTHLVTMMAEGTQARRWVTEGDPRVCEQCLKNARAGAVPMDQDFPSGHAFPPGHVRCRCRLVEVT